MERAPGLVVVVVRLAGSGTGWGLDGDWMGRGRRYVMLYHNFSAIMRCYNITLIMIHYIITNDIMYHYGSSRRGAKGLRWGCYIPVSCDFLNFFW